MIQHRATRADDRAETIMRAALDVAQEVGFAKLSIEGVAARAGVGKHTVYRRWSSKGQLFLDSLLSLNGPVLDYQDTGDIKADLRRQIHAAVDLLGTPPWGPLYQALLGEAQHDAAVSASLNERFIRPQAEKTVARIKAAQEQGQVAADFDLELVMSILSGPLYFQFLVAGQPVTHDYVDRMLEALFAGLGPRP
ncbi:TetR/AcrR family transcriptional regulator [Amycolatopsis magusensis]|uniref:TetR/AcrR family transcriptional regulator n=1 Tax=Amycolatopsis magusensis TaxID=882444 RepID=UPI003C2DA0A6